MIYVEICSKKRLPTEEAPPMAELRLPASEVEIAQAFEKAGITDSADCEIKYIAAETELLDIKLDAIVYGENAIDELNYLATQLTDMDQYDRNLFDGMIIIEKPATMKDLINLVANLDNIHFVPDIKNTKQLGEFLVENGFVEIDPDFLKYIDYKKVGQERLDDGDCCITANGYFEDGRRPEEIVEVYDGVTLPANDLDSQNYDMSDHMQM